MRNCICLRGKTMTEKNQKTTNELDAVFDTLMEDIPIGKAYRVRDAVIKEGRTIWKPALYIVFAFAIMMLILCGTLVIGDYFGLNGEPTDWEKIGVVCVFLPTFTLLGFVICHETIMDKIRSRLRHVLDDALEEYVKEKSTETGNKPN